MRRLMLGLFTLFILFSSTTELFSYISVLPQREPNRFTVSQGIELTDHDPITITDDSHFSEMGFPGSGTSEDPYVIDDLMIVDEDSGIHISGTISFFTIRNCFLTCRNAGAIQLENVYNGEIDDCRIKGGQFGINLSNCSYIEIASTIIAGSHASGIFVNNHGYSISISNNRIFGCETGIFVENSENCTINLNRIYYNRFGIHLLDDAYNNMITQNSLGWNNNQGNRFGDNIDGGNAHDSGANNYWDGNSWSDYSSVDAWYEIGGGIISQDLNPSSLFDLSSPVITISEIDMVIEGNSSAFLCWTINEEFPVSFELYQNTIVIDEGYLTTDILVQPLGSLSYGTYNFTILIRDVVGNIETLEHDIQVVSPVVEVFIIFSLGVGICVVTILPLDYLLRIRKRKIIDELESDASEDEILEPSQLLE